MNYKQCRAMVEALTSQRDRVRSALRQVSGQTSNQIVGQTSEIILNSLILAYEEAAKFAEDRGVS